MLAERGEGQDGVVDGRFKVGVLEEEVGVKGIGEHGTATGDEEIKAATVFWGALVGCRRIEDREMA